jgi:hypothetical protein
MKHSDAPRFFLAKRLLLYLGSLCDGTLLQRFDSALSYLEVGHWMKARGIDASERVHSREELFRKLVYLTLLLDATNNLRFCFEYYRNTLD